MFGSTPPSSPYVDLPDPTTTKLQQYTSALRRQLATI